MRESRLSGSVGGERGKILAHSANVGIIRSPVRAIVLPDHLAFVLKTRCSACKPQRMARRLKRHRGLIEATSFRSRCSIRARHCSRRHR
jgi:hypothetical protein